MSGKMAVTHARYWQGRRQIDLLLKALGVVVFFLQMFSIHALFAVSAALVYGPLSASLVASCLAYTAICNTKTDARITNNKMYTIDIFSIISLKLSSRFTVTKKRQWFVCWHSRWLIFPVHNFLSSHHRHHYHRHHHCQHQLAYNKHTLSCVTVLKYYAYSILVLVNMGLVPLESKTTAPFDLFEKPAHLI